MKKIIVFLKNKKKILLKLFLLFIILYICFVCVTKKQIIFSLIKDQFNFRQQQENVKIDNNIDIDNTINQLNNSIEKIISENNKLNIKLLEIENNLNNIQTETEDLKQYINKIENQNPVYNEKNIQIIVLLNKIQNLYYNNRSFLTELDFLKLLVQSKNDLLELVLQLDIYKESEDIEEIKIIFKQEYIKLLNNKEKSNFFTDFINENIKIRKINNVDNDDVLNIIINQIENEINKNNYDNVINLIENNNLNIDLKNDAFAKTFNISNKIINFNKIIDSIYKRIYEQY